MRIVVRLAVLLIALLGGAIGFVYLRYGGGGIFPDRTGEPTLSADALEVVADLEYPPGNIAVSDDGRVFFTLHPEGAPPLSVVELRDGKPVAWPPDLPAELAYQSVLSIRIDRQGRLWALDNARHGFGTPRILAFDLATGALAYRHDFPRSAAGRGSHLNDFQVSPDGTHVYIADASILRHDPVLLVLDVESGTSRRLLSGHESVVPQRYTPVVQGRRMALFGGLFAIRPGVDSIALDRAGEWLYFAPVMNEHLYRVRTADLLDATLAPDAIAARVERYAPKTPSDGITTDLDGNVYLTDADESAIVRLDTDRSLTTLLKEERLRWPDGAGFGPDGWLYFTCSALHQVIGRGAEQIRAGAPYQIFRFRPGPAGIPGH
jgi:sugar lactone lactonase YvrE